MESTYLPRIGRPWYQYIELDGKPRRSGSDKAWRRTQPLISWVRKLVQPQHNVLDVGCCSGLYTLVAGETCKKAVGVDIDRDFILQARWLHKEWEQKLGRKLGNVSFHTLDISKRLELLADTDFLIVAKILYHKHFRPYLDSFMTALKESKIRTVLGQGHTVRGALGKTVGMRKLFSRYGFTTELLEDVPEYPIIVARR